MLTIIIPAYNEEAVIGHCLNALTRDLHSGEAEIIVACNACKDRTAEIARTFPGVTVLETETPGKSNALNMADRVARYFPRIYVDADVRMSMASARRVAEVLSGGEVHAASPHLLVDLQGCSWPLRAYYNIWTRMPYCTQGMVGSGVYALSEAGRLRFEEYPDLMADDEFIRLLFAPGERITVHNCSFTISAPTSFGSLLMLRRRWERANRQIDKHFHGVRENEQRDYASVLKPLLCQPRLWPDLALYAFVLASSRLGAAVQLRFAKNPWKWGRDDTARQKLGNSDKS